jgi:hypothetical protein
MNPHRKAPEGSLATTPTVENLAASLREMLAVYWGDGDGHPPPEFIRQAQLLVVAAALASAKG